MRKKTTILSIGEKKDFDSYLKFHRQRRLIRDKGFVYRSVDFERLFSGKAPAVKNEKVIAFVFFPFKYWDDHIEHERYRGLYGNLTFYRKFKKYGKNVLKRLKDIISADEVILVNDPVAASRFRDKQVLKDHLAKKGVNVPRHIRAGRAGDIEKLLDGGGRVFIKPRCGSMGKGITYLEKGRWETNFDIRGGRILNRHSDYGWVFRDVTGNRAFLKGLLGKDVIIEEAIDPLRIKGRIVDFRVYAFLDKVLYIYPRKGKSGVVTTNISQGAKGSPRLRSDLPAKAIERIEDQAVAALKALDLRFAGIDVMLDKKLKRAYVIDVNMFPGFPKAKTFNMANSIISELSKL